MVTCMLLESYSKQREVHPNVTIWHDFCSFSVQSPCLNLLQGNEAAHDAETSLFVCAESQWCVVRVGMATQKPSAERKLLIITSMKSVDHD